MWLFALAPSPKGSREGVHQGRGVPYRTVGKPQSWRRCSGLELAGQQPSPGLLSLSRVGGKGRKLGRGQF